MNLESLETYAESCRALARERFAGLDAAGVLALEDDYNAYPALSSLAPPRSLTTLEEGLGGGTEEKAKKAILEGFILWMHTAAGEASRLKLGPKYLIHPHDETFKQSHCRPETAPGGEGGAPPDPAGLLPLRLGPRHLWQLVFEIKALAEEAGLAPRAVLARQKMLLVVNERIRGVVCDHLAKQEFLGLAPENFLMMVQPSFHGLRPQNGLWNFDVSAAPRLHNHGQMVMQMTMDDQIFHLDAGGRVHGLSRAQFFSRLDAVLDLVSYNIEDLGYLTRALDFASLGLALELGEQGYGMTMEIVPNNPDHPVKGGLCAYDPGLGRDVVIESFRLRGLAPRQIAFLNKNFNHYPNPGRLFRQLRREGLFMPVSVKEGALYFQPAQGDLNFLTKTAFLTRRSPAPLSSWKSPEDTPAALAAMARQDRQPGFADFTRRAFERL
jgi:hypothetical protein